MKTLDTLKDWDRCWANKPVLLGEAPSADGSDYLLGRSGKRVAQLANVPWDLFPAVFDARNLIRFLGVVGKGHAWDEEDARLRAHILCFTGFFQERVAVLLGQRVKKAFAEDIPLGQNFEWVRFSRGWVTWMPHPSGINRWYNDEGNLIEAADFLTRLARGKP